jgi:DNA polymerase-4
VPRSPEEVDSLFLPLSAGRDRFWKDEKLKHLEVQTIADLRRMDLATLEGRFGRYGVRLYELARGIDNSEVVPDRPTQSISAEDTFEQDVLLPEMESMIRKLAEHTWAASRKESRIARTVVLKLKTSDLKILTRNHTPGSPPASCEQLTSIALSLRERVGLSPVPAVSPGGRRPE